MREVNWLTELRQLDIDQLFYAVDHKIEKAVANLRPSLWKKWTEDPDYKEPPYLIDSFEIVGNRVEVILSLARLLMITAEGNTAAPTREDVVATIMEDGAVIFHLES
jgi:hypothetical protein